MEPTKHIEITPGVCSGRPRVAGTRIRVENVVRWTEQGMLPDEIVASYPQLTPADVHSALAFYFDNRDEIERQMREDSEFINAMMAKQGCRLTPASVHPTANHLPAREGY
jgi:uncharacterized protein (DUF433 family)